MDGFGLMDYNARYYDPLLGRFISPDTIIPQPSSPLAWDRYSYTYNNPIQYTDPSGHRVCGDMEEINCDGFMNASIKKTNSVWLDPVDPMVVGGGYTYSLTHHAIDLNPDDEGNPNPAIIASTFGVVHSSNSCNIDPCDGKSVGANAGYGNMVIIEYYYAALPRDIQAHVEDGSSVYILYAHLNESSRLREHDIVSPGQAIGNVGTTGNSTSVHLHMEVKIQYTNERLPFDKLSDGESYTILYSFWFNPNLMQQVDPNTYFTIANPE